MPELPEVETVVRTLEYQLGNRTIQSVKVLWKNIVANKTIEEFAKCLENQRFEEYHRRGKFLLFSLTDYILVAHLRMEGKFYVYKEKTEPFKHTHIIFELDEGQLHYNDVRKFGRFYLYKKGEALDCLSKLGYEPWDEKLTAAYCKSYCANNRTPIKSMLLDQGMIAGIGNIYADEICFASKIHPLTPSCFVSLDKWKQIITSTRTILANAIKDGGTTIRSYTSSLGVTGLFQLSLRVHSRENHCDDCDTEIVKIRVGGRGTYYCPNCQKRKPVTLAITGTIGSGKSAVMSLLKEKGIKTISCDAVNSELLDKEETIKDLAKIFDCDYRIVDRRFITEKIFSDASLKKKVEGYLHAKIYQSILQFVSENEEDEILGIEVPLLFEVNWDEHFDVNTVVVSDKETIYKRLMENRSMSEKQIDERYNKQMSVEEKKKRADYVIENNSDMACLSIEVDALLKKIRKQNNF